MTTPCAQSDPELWFSSKPREIALAVSLCQECPIKAECYALAVKNDERNGVWGGTDFNSEYKLTEKLPPETSGKKIDPNKGYVTGSLSSKKNIIGGTCRSGKHVLSPANTTRSSSNALMCIPCMKRVKDNFLKTENYR